MHLVHASTQYMGLPFPLYQPTGFDSDVAKLQSLDISKPRLDLSLAQDTRVSRLKTADVLSDLTPLHLRFFVGRSESCVMSESFPRNAIVQKQ